MATNNIPLLELLHKAGADKDMDFLREAVQVLSQAIIELEASEKSVPHHTSVLMAGPHSAADTGTDLGIHVSELSH